MPGYLTRLSASGFSKSVLWYVPRIHPSGGYYCSKRVSVGIGIESVRSVVAHYNGVCQLDAHDNTFTAKVMLYI